MKLTSSPPDIIRLLVLRNMRQQMPGVRYPVTPCKGAIKPMNLLTTPSTP